MLAHLAVWLVGPDAGGEGGGGVGVTSSAVAVLRGIAFSPRALKGTLLPGQPEDAASMAVRVMGGMWYKCPSGHPYYVDACGRPVGSF